MSDLIQPATKEKLRNYLRRLRSLTNETAKREAFAALLGELFPGHNVINHYFQGVEKGIRIQTAAGIKRGRADAYHGSAIIEFERSLKASLNTAEDQLREYVAGEWQRDSALRPLQAIATDGVQWIVYRPLLPVDAAVTPANVKLEKIREFTVAEDTLTTFWLFLENFLTAEQQLEPTAARFQWNFGSSSFVFRDSMAALKRAWTEASQHPEAHLAFETWQRYLAVTYGKLTESASARHDVEVGGNISELEGLFLRHTYLASVARLMVWAALSHGKSSGNLRQVASDVFSGEYFLRMRLANLVDEDFFHWVSTPIAEVVLGSTWEAVLSQLLNYDLSRMGEDVLKGVYQELIDPKDRHDLGEYYTPDWLCERVVEEMLPVEGYKSVLDPSCGSGSFLRAAIAHFTVHNPSGTDNDRLRVLLANVVGVDIHPVAVTIARANYVLALGKLIKAARTPIQIPVYLADSLFLPREVEADLLQNLHGVLIQYGPRKDTRKFVLPRVLVHAPEAFDQAIAACARVAAEHALTNGDSLSSLDQYLHREVPALTTMDGYDQILSALWNFSEGLAELIRQKNNSIWSFIIRNSYRPAMLRDKFDIIIGNPPWLSYRYIEDQEYQAEIKSRAVDTYKIAPKSQKLFTQMELGTVFLAHSMATFAALHGKLAFVLPRAVLSADQHQNLIQRTYDKSARFRLTGYWDLWGVAPLFNVPSCVLFAERSDTPGDASAPLDVLEWHGKLPERDLKWNRAKPLLGAEGKKGRVIYLGQRSALSTEPGTSTKQSPGAYLNIFHQGATIVPRSLYFVKVSGLESSFSEQQTYWAETDPLQAAEAKKPYREVHVTGSLEGKFLFSTVISKHVLPFVMLPPATVFLPVDANADTGTLSIRDTSWLRREGYRNAFKWLAQAESIWEQKRGEKAGEHSLLQWLDYSGKLSSQNLKQRHLVLYNAAGTNVSATYYDRSAQSPPFVVDTTLYWAAFSHVAEAHYVAAALNSQTANQLIKPFQSAGLFGKRHVHKKLLELPFPTFNPDKKLHVNLSTLGESAAMQAALATADSAFPAAGSLARQRAFVRTAIESTLGQIDALVRELLGL